MQTKFILITLFLLFVPNLAFAFGSVNPAAINQYKYYQTTPCWNRTMKVNRPCIYSEQQARYYGYRTYSDNSFNQTNGNMYNNTYSSGYSYK